MAYWIYMPNSSFKWYTLPWLFPYTFSFISFDWAAKRFTGISRSWPTNSGWIDCLGHRISAVSEIILGAILQQNSHCDEWSSNFNLACKDNRILWVKNTLLPSILANLQIN